MGSRLDEEEDRPSGLIPDDFETEYEEKRAVRPPYSPEEGKKALRWSTRFGRSIDIIGTNTVGMGYDLKFRPPDGADDLAPTDEALDERRRIANELEIVPPGYISIGEVEQQVLMDEEISGNGFQEVVRSVSGEMSLTEGMPLRKGASMFARVKRAPAETIRVMADPDSGEPMGYVQMRRDGWGQLRKRYFKMFGDRRAMNKHTGVFSEAVQLRDRATEIIHDKLFNPVNDYYGLPRWRAAQRSLLYGYMSTIRLLNTIRNDPGVPAVIGLMEGTLDTKQSDMIFDLMSPRGQAVHKAGRWLYLHPHRATFNKDPKMEVQQLEPGLRETEALLTVVSNAADELREVWGLSPLYYGSTADIGRAAAAVARQVTNEQVFLPILRRKEGRINRTLLRAMGAKHTVFLFRRPKATDAIQDSIILSKLGAPQILSVNQIIDVLNRLVYDLDIPVVREPWADVPLASSRKMGKDAKKAIEAATGKIMGLLGRKLSENADPSA